MKKSYFYPIWLRFWHWFNALLFFILIATGISLHYSDTTTIFFTFKIAMLGHNIAGILLSLIYIYYISTNFVTGNYKQYIPGLKGLVKKIKKQVRYYLLDIFSREPHPFHSTEKERFNPLQRISYFFIIFLFLPLIIISGWLLMFPELAPNEIWGMGGVWPMSVLHYIIGFILSLFMFVHIYLGTTGKTIGELFKSMMTGWHLSEENEEEISEVTVTPVIQGTRKKIFPIIFYNPITITGSILSIVSFLCILFLIVIEYFSDNSSPYTGIVAFVVLPSFLILGLLLIAFGIFKENRRALSKDAKKRGLPIIDLNNPKHQIATMVFSVGTIVLVVFSVFGSFKAYEYTDSDEFCGKVCHKVMEPEFTAYQDSPHSRVGCVKCHIGPGTGWFVKSKLSGTYQVYSVLFNKYPTPIATPVANLRPAPETCEQCHWPKQFYHENKVSFDFFTSDEKNSEYKLSMAIKIGGGNIDLGNNSGIHWVMNISNEITYLAQDKERMIIPWVKSKSLITGKETVYKSIDSKISDDALRPELLRKMDCIDCHNRPSHIYNQPNKIVNSYLSANLIDKNLPYIKNLSVQVMENYITDRNTAKDDIKNFIWKFYKSTYPEIAQNQQPSIDNSIEQLNKIYHRNYFPDMKVNWKNFPNNIGHMYSPGCFRCHDGKHVSNEGKVISNDCNVCHIIVSQQAPSKQLEESNTGLPFNHPGGIDKLVKNAQCYNCHGAYPSKKKGA